MTVMKTLAWKDRGQVTRGRDAIDLVELLLRAEDIIGLKTLYEHHLETVEEAGGDPQLAGARILGAEASMAAGALMAEEVASILAKGLEENLVTQVLGGSGGMPSANRNDAITNILKAFLSGLQPNPHPSRVQ
jgi:predicted nucleotidyltransferase